MPKIPRTNTGRRERWSCVIAVGRKGEGHTAQAAWLRGSERMDVFVFSAPFRWACCNRETLPSSQKAIPAKKPCAQARRQTRPSHLPGLQMLHQINQGQRMCFVIKNQEQDWRSRKSRRPGASLSSCFPHGRPASSRTLQRNLCLV